MKYLISSSFNRCTVFFIALLIFGIGIVGCSKTQELQGVTEQAVPQDEVETPVGGDVETPQEETPPVQDQQEPELETSAPESDLQLIPQGFGIKLLTKPKFKIKMGVPEVIELPSEKEGKGLYLVDLNNEMKFTKEIGKKLNAGEDFALSCKALDKNSEPRDVISELNARAGFDSIHQLSIRCNDIQEVGVSDAQSSQLSAGKAMGDSYSINPPTGFVFAGWYAHSCMDGPFAKVGPIIPYSKKLNKWGANDEVMWASPQIGRPVSGFCEWKLNLCPENSVLSGIDGQFYSGKFGEELNFLKGFCHKVVNDDLAKPKVASVSLTNLEKIQAPMGVSGNACLLSCRDDKHPNGLVVGFNAITSKELIGDVEVVTQVQLRCKEVTKEGLQSSYTTSTCGYNSGGEKQKSVFFTPGIVANGVYVRAGDLFDQLSLYGTMLDVFDYEEPIWIGNVNENGKSVEKVTFLVQSPKVGGDGGAELRKQCPARKVMTGITFSSGYFNYDSGSHSFTAGTEYDIPTVFGIREFTCAGVNRVLE